MNVKLGYDISTRVDTGEKEKEKLIPRAQQRSATETAGFEEQPEIGRRKRGKVFEEQAVVDGEYMLTRSGPNITKSM
jgi:hypothetical protein